MAQSGGQLLIRFRGICALISIKGTKKKRAVLVRHVSGNSGIEHHIAYVEFYADDIEKFPPELKVLRYTRPGVDGTFARFDLDEPTEIRIKDQMPGDVDEALNYDRDVPHMSQILPGDEENHRVAASLLGPAKNIDGNRAMAVFDMPAGLLIPGEPEALLTRFPPPVEFEERRLARWTDLHTTVEAPLTLQLIQLTTARPETREVVFKKTLRMLTIGNEPERLILGVMRPSEDHVHAVGHASAHDMDASPIQPTGHYVLYYDVLENRPESCPVPIPTQLEGSGCPNNAYP